MKLFRVCAFAAAGLSVTACAASDEGLGLSGQRTVFYNPYAAPELPNATDGVPVCEACEGAEKADDYVDLGRGHITAIKNRNTQALTLDEQRAIQRRNERRAKRLRKKRGDDRPNPEPWPNGR